MRALFFITLSLLFLAFHAPQPAFAQGVGSLFLDNAADEETEAPTVSSEVQEIIRQAQENGMSVLVIGADGQVVSDTSAEGSEVTAAEDQMPGSTFMKAQDSAVQFRAALIQRMLDLPNDFNEVAYILRATSPDGTIWLFFEIFYLSMLLFAIGMIVEKFVYGKRIAVRWVVSRTVDNPQGYSEKMPFLVFRFCMGVIGILVTMAVAYVIGFLVFGPLDDPGMQFTAGIINAGYFLSRFVAQLWRMILSPFLPQYRIPLLETAEARRLYYWLVALTTFDICRLLFGIWISELGLNYDVFAFMTVVLSVVLVAMNILMILVNRAPLTRAIQMGQPPETLSVGARLVSSAWAPLAIFYLIVAWAHVSYTMVLGSPPRVPLIAGAYVILLSILVVYGVINFLIERSFARARALRELNADNPDNEENTAAVGVMAGGAKLYIPKAMTTFEDLARRVAGILAFVAGTYAFFYIWDTDSTEMVESYANRLLDVMVIIFIGYIVYQVFRIWIDKKIASEQGEVADVEPGDEGGASSASRLATLLPLFRNFILIVVTVAISLIVLMELGINVGPLFAGAGVVGVAVGFGSQALVRDIFSGGFFLFDDAFRKGEYLDVGGVKGTVEKISVRSFQLRHHLGALHTIPFGEIQVMTNYSRDWVIMKLPLRLTYDTDVEHVRKLIKKLGVQLLDDPVIGENFIQPLKSQGVIEMQDSAMIVRVKFMTKPGDQWLVRKKVYEEIRILFEREGIKFAHKEVTVRLADGKVDELSEEDKKSITAAAQASIEEDMLDDDMDGGGDDR